MGYLQGPWTYSYLNAYDLLVDLIYPVPIQIQIISDVSLHKSSNKNFFFNMNIELRWEWLLLTLSFCCGMVKLNLLGLPCEPYHHLTLFFQILSKKF